MSQMKTTPVQISVHNDKSLKLKGWAWTIATLLFFQASDVTLRLASVDTHFAVGTMLMAIPLLLVTAVATARICKKEKARLTPRAWTLASTYGLFQFVAGNAMFFLAVKFGGLTIATPSVQSQAIWAVLLGGLILKERISRTMVMGTLCFVAGLFVLSWFKAAGTDVSEAWMWAILFGLLGGLSWTSASVVQRSQLQKGVPLPFILAVGSLTGVVVFNVLIFTTFGAAAAWGNVSAIGILKVIAVGCFNGMAIFSFSQAIRLVEISKVIPVISLNIVFNTINGGLWFNEFISMGTFIGMLIAFIGVIIVQEPPFLQRLTLSGRHSRVKQG